MSSQITIHELKLNCSGFLFERKEGSLQKVSVSSKVGTNNLNRRPFIIISGGNCFAKLFTI